ncbi:MAG: hypothetical protein C5B59_17370 [Bacteroidetes bacterium]|nr:MAG: hypothetical protein C5B59_17370 [Bacteroidota bacterium]
MKAREVPLSEIKIGNRFRKGLGDLSEMVEGVKQYGIIQPITLDLDLNLIAGQRRYEAAKLAGLKTIPAVIRPVTGEIDALEIELFENIHRLDFSWQERANLERRLFDLHKAKDPDWSLSQQAALSDMSKSEVHRRIELAQSLDLVPGLAEIPTQKQAWRALSAVKEETVRMALASAAEGKYADASKAANNHYKIGDAFQGLSEVNDGVLNFAEVDPPYAIELEKRKARNQVNNAKRYREVSEEDYEHFVRDMARLVYHKLRNNTFCVWWYAPDWSAIVQETLEDVGFTVGSIPCIWYKGQSGQTSSPDTMLASSYEPFFLCRKGMPKLRKPGRSNVFDFAPLAPAKKIHPTERPVELMVELLRTFAWPGSVICSPFLGSGSILRAAYKEHMVGYGWDLDDTVKHRFLTRVVNDRKEEAGDDVSEEQEDEDGDV